MRFLGSICAVTILFSAINANACSSASAKAQTKPVETPPADKQLLERADLRITGSSCAACIMRVERKINQAPGVIKAAASIFTPFHTIIIYDPAITNIKKIRAAVTGETIKFEHVSEQPITEVPKVLLPPAGHLEGQIYH